MDERASKRRGPLTWLATNRKARWWTIAVLYGAPVLYVLSFGPACRIASHLGAESLLATAYQPLMRIWWRGESPRAPDMLLQYVNLYSADRLHWMFNARQDGSYFAMLYRPVPNSSLVELVKTRRSLSVRNLPLGLAEISGDKCSENSGTLINADRH